MKPIEEIIKENINWAKAWSRIFYLTIHQKEVDINKYSNEIRKLLNGLKCNYNKLDAMLVLKDILYNK